ncbi:MAG: transcription termination/antitermination protein NusG [Clostridia bacterium]|jgi:transcriptional antiterminator NusG|nr:transcription termination/antitermination protein NusG [Clostridia bacterium]MDO4835921.1 transcription termination/antitermination NusG family protein [Clostridia bacterium]
MSQETKWYVVHTYSGYENKVKEDLIKAVENAGLSDTILEVMYPTEETIEILPTGKRKSVTRKVYPGYVMVKMVVDVVEKERPAEMGGGVSRELVMNPRAWYVIRNTRGVTGFVGPGSKPVPLKDEEVVAMGVERIPIVLNIEVGETVRVVSGPLENFLGRVDKIDPERQKVKLSVSMFGRETPVELDFIQVQKI